MARKRTDTADYFPHMARPGKTLFILEEKFGNDGYAFWFKLLEIITTAEGHYYDCSDETNWFFLLAKTRVSGITGSEMLDILSKLNQIDSELWKEKKIIWIQGLIDNISDVYARRGRATPLKPKTSNATLCYITDSEITPEEVFPNQKSPKTDIPESVIPKVKESKVKYIKDIPLNEVSKNETSLTDGQSLVVVSKEGIKAVEVAKNPNVKVFIDYAYQTFKDKYGIALHIDGKKDGSIIKNLLGTYPIETLTSLWNEYMRRYEGEEDSFLQQAGISIGVFKSQINKLLLKPPARQTGNAVVDAARSTLTKRFQEGRYDRE